MTIEEMRKKKQEMGYSNQKLSELSGVPLGTVAKVFAGTTGSPRYETLHALEKVLNPGLRYTDPPASASQGVREAISSYNSSASPGLHTSYEDGSSARRSVSSDGYTLEDYLNLPDDGPRKELIDGIFYDMGEPAIPHQAIVGYVYKKLLDFVMEHGGPCMPMISPVAVQLDRDDKTVVEPDVAIVCDRSQFQKGRIMGAPDFIMEVLSPSTRRKDMNLKAYKYQNAGVKEYWLMDPSAQKLLVYDYAEGSFPAIYGFHDKVPVLIWDKKCVIDLDEMYRLMGFLLEL